MSAHAESVRVIGDCEGAFKKVKNNRLEQQAPIAEGTNCIFRVSTSQEEAVESETWWLKSVADFDGPLRTEASFPLNGRRARNIPIKWNNQKCFYAVLSENDRFEISGDAAVTVIIDTLRLIDERKNGQGECVQFTPRATPTPGGPLISWSDGPRDKEITLRLYKIPKLFRSAVPRWNFGDGTRAEGSTVAHLYEDYGLYRVKARLVAPDGTVVKTSQFISVSSVPTPIPTPTATPG